VNGITAIVVGVDQSLFTVDDVPTTLGANAQATLDIRYAPLALETRSLGDVVFVGSESEEATLSLFGEPVGAALTLIPNPINFGFVPLMTPAIGCTTITNQSDLSTAVDVTSLVEGDGGPFAISQVDNSTPPSPAPIPTTIPGGANAKVCFQFLPLLAEQYSAQAMLRCDSPSGVINPVVELTAWGGGPRISCTPAALFFGETLVGHIATAAVLCTNVGTDVTPLANLLLEPPTASPSVFTAQFDPGLEAYPLDGLSPGYSAQIDVSYAPTDAGSDEGTLSISSNGDLGRALQIPLTGQALAIPPCQFVVAPTPPLDFGNVALGATSAPQQIELENVGTNICLVQDLGVADDRTGSFHIVSTSIAPDSTTGNITIPAPAEGVISNLVIALDFAPTTTGVFSAELQFSVALPEGPFQEAKLTGTSD
jgi:hypothetical protein